MPGQSLPEIIQGLLLRGYNQAAGSTLSAIGALNKRGRIPQRLREFEAEAQRLLEAGEKLGPDNPVLAALMFDLEAELGRAAVRIGAASGGIQGSGAALAGQLTRQLALPGMDDGARIVLGWNIPDPEAINALVGFVDNPAWAYELRQYPSRVAQAIKNQAILGFTQGWGPMRTAQQIMRMAGTLPEAQANMLMRTLHLQSYRTATAITQNQNSHILEGQVRVAALDERTCLACIALHGEVMPVGERVNDHHNGRCTSIGLVRGRPREVTTGSEWFERQPEDRQLTIAGPGKLEALRSGRARLRDFVRPYEDPVFGDMVREGALSALTP